MKKQISTLRSFSGGQINAGAKRRDETEEYRTAALIMSDWRIESTETIVPRPGRRLLAATGAPRMEYARVGSTNYGIAFGVDASGHGQITIYDLSTNLPIAVNATATYAWTLANTGLINFDVADNQIVVCFPGMRPQLAIRAPTTAAWSFAPFVFRTVTRQSQQPFYRATNFGATMAWSQVTGAITLTCSQPYFTAAMVGNVISILGQQVVITSVASPTSAGATVQNRLPDFINVAVTDMTPFLSGQIAELQSGAFKMEVDTVVPAPTTSYPTAGIVGGVITSAVINSHVFVTTDVLVSELGSAAVTGQATFQNGFTVQWQEQFMGDTLGWPMACGYDKSRLIFFDFPQKPEAVLWSAIGAFDTFWIDSSAATLQSAAGADAQSAILEFIPESPRVRHVIGWGDEFVFTDKGIYQIPISASGNPLKPGSVEFRQFSNDGVSPIVPIKTQDSIVYINAGTKRCSVVAATGSYTRPYISEDMADMHTDLFTGPVAMAVATGDGPFPERLIYVLNADGSIIHGKYTKDKKFVGWLPWYPAVAASWLFGSSQAIFYCIPLAGGSFWLAAEDAALYLDEAITPNAQPATFPPAPAGQGPYWFLAGRSVTLMDGLLDMGDRAIDASGNLVLNGPEDVLTSPTLTVGLPFQPKLQPFVPAAQPGESVGQRQHRRKVSRAMVTVEQSTGFQLGARDYPAYQQGDDATKPPPPRDMVVQSRPLGRAFDPGVLLVKTRPGSLRVVEYSTECTI